MKNKSVKKWICLCLCSAMLAGCGSAAARMPDEFSAVQIVDESQDNSKSQDAYGQQQDESQRKELTPVEQIGRYERAAYLADMVYEQNGSVNTMVSPLSLDMALGLVSGGAKGQTREELLTYLGTEDYGAFAKQYMEYAEGLNTDPESSLYPSYYKMAYEIANSIWVKDDRKLVDAYVDEAKEQYDARIEAVSFDQGKRSQTVKQINGWCNDKTHELIPEIISDGAITDDTVAVLLNSLYFESPWREDWNLADHRFTDFEGTVTEQEMLRDTVSSYYENEYATAFAKEYRNGMKFIGILPKETGEFSLADLDVESLVASENTEYDVKALMPKLDFDTTANNIVDILKAQGVETVFDKEQSDMTGFVEMDTDEVTYISDIIQKTNIQLDEKGTKAAAVTAVIMECKATALSKEREEKQVYLDRPFAFLIYDETNEQIVFMGKVVTL